jgi:hypothetical protein
MDPGRGSQSGEVLDCSRPGPLLFWFAVGAGLALVVMSAYAAPDWTRLLRVGWANPLLTRMEGELGPIATRDRTGHDGQLYYLIARDPLGTDGTPQAIAVFDNNGPRYRYRRILYPWLSGGVGQFGARATLLGMIGWLVFATGLATVAIADLCFQLNLRGVAVLAATTNAGALASLLFLTADALALALALSGLALALRRRYGLATAAFALAVLTKETYVLVPMSLAAWMGQDGRRTAALAIIGLPAATLAAWSIWVLASIPAVEGSVSNIGLPLAGIAEGVTTWIRDERNTAELLLGAFVCLTFLSASLALVISRTSALAWVIVPWLGLASTATLSVWGKPNNVARAFAVLWPLSVLTVVHGVSHRQARRTTRPPQAADATR